MPFYKIFYFNVFDDHTQKLKSFQYQVYPCISALELDVLQTLQVQLWTVHFLVTLCTQRRKTVYFYNSLQLFSWTHWDKEDNITLFTYS